MELSPKYSNTVAQIEQENPPKFFGYGSEFKTTNGEVSIEWEPIQNITSNAGIYNCFIGEIREASIAPFKAPEVVREIHFDSYISHSNFLTLVTPLVNLKLLEIHVSSLEGLNMGQTYLDLPNLECLEISSTNFTYYHALQADMNVIVENICSILTHPNSFPMLTYLSISIPTYPPIDEEFARSILHCLAAHKSTIKFLNVEAEYVVLTDPSGHMFEEHLYKESPLKQDLNSSTIKSTGGLRLASFHFFSLVKTASTSIWRRFIETQDTLEYLQFWCEEKAFPFPKEYLETRNPQLQTIALNIDVLSETPQIDLRVFEGHPHLKTLFLKGNVKFPPNYDTSAQNIINTDSLPKTLEFVKIMNLLLDKEEAAYLVTELPNLKNFCLKEVGEENDFGLRVSDLSNFLMKERVQRIEIVSSMNRSSFCDSCIGGDGYEIMAKILFGKQEKTNFRVSKNLKGCFDLLSDEEEEEEEEEDECEVEIEDDDGSECIESLPEVECQEIEEETSSPQSQAKVDENEDSIGSRTSQDPPDFDGNISNIRDGSIYVNPNFNSDEDFKPLASAQGRASLEDEPNSRLNVVFQTTTGEFNPHPEGPDEEVSELVDEEEANLDIFVQDFSSDKEPRS